MYAIAWKCVVNVAEYGPALRSLNPDELDMYDFHEVALGQVGVQLDQASQKTRDYRCLLLIYSINVEVSTLVTHFLASIVRHLQAITPQLATNK
ncbi:hypothetical protein A2738_03695 [Candidatus Nomurabacteria bacterium RIFCSPHIGHO2_01_FULL_42_15]|uniref:Uncharacterized protein n=1 Tax=Candidatus Nomurabacteria bacterium RIFCSPHIGHO2_01_FULL_42_15 TaxID=1801742 RepID=A0A1F6VE24_9BACT|nr:MAG: hypothetical protein A2738_03695 [Candidatus Nomurabacteria bacterium RIFCSPHIGHO2_01_FULL_42_15]OGI93307.1 MAG: hypothetical protein A3A99_03550 [Candidatus Nomurabacteria bacterium RIFCSPLOWO2_01_FULL_41_18]